ncbi:dTDP-4-dehydrorhamnose 3,5-epimerase [Candidatus Kaiserbacteria bacterium]|nr:dTDP-4-dehydrorhamnose 3,5-epimerase [Candidatus Kaiserbacteria bacterium]
MKFLETEVRGAYIVELDVKEDERGFFARVWDEEEFKKHGLFDHIVHANISGNPKKGTLRGLHFQIAPHEEAKIVRCSRGAIFDVAVDIRPDSPSFKKWISVELSEQNRRMSYIPEGCAHGFQTLEDNSEVSYFMSAAYHPLCARGVRFDDPVFGISWPLPISVISEKDKTYPDFS